MGRRPRVGGTVDRVRDLIDDVLIEITARRGRALLMIVGVALSVGALVASLGISQTAGRQIATDIAASTLDLVQVNVSPSARTTASDTAERDQSTVFPADSDARAASVPMVRAAGRILDLTATAGMRATRLPDSATTAESPTVMAATSGYLAAAEATGAATVTWMLDWTAPVAILGTAAAERLGVPVTDNPTGLEVWIDAHAIPVVGFVSGPESVRSSVFVPYAFGLAAVGSDSQSVMLVRTEPGAGSPVAGVITTALRPDHTELLTTSAVSTLGSLRQGVSGQLGRLVATIAGFLLVLTVLLIANSMVVSVVARTSEIGLRRALGSSQAGVSAVFWAEGALVGLLGGCAGAAMSTLVVVVVSASMDWTPAINLPATLVSPLLGAVVGVLASLQPALRAGRTSPAVAVRAD